MTVLAARRRALRTALGEKITAAGLNTYSTVPSRFVPPAAFIGPGDPYLTRDGAAYGCEVLNLVVVVVGGKGISDQKADELDDLVELVLDALYDVEGSEQFEGMAVGDVGDPGPISPNNQGPYLSAPIGVRIEINRREQP